MAKLYRDAIEIPQMGSIYRVLSAEAYTKEGLNPSLVIFDEVHVQPDDELWNVMMLGSGTRRQPLVMGITTAGVKVDSKGRPSLCYRLWNKGRANDDPAFFFRWYAAPDGADYTDREVWRAANPAFGDYLFEEDFETVVRSVHENEFRTKRLNQWVNTATAWLPQGAWEAVARPDKPFDPAKPFAVFLDGSWSNDSTGLVACTLDEPHLSVLGHWIPDPSLGHIDMGLVEKRVREVLAMPGCRGLAFDPAFLADLFGRLEAEFNRNRDLIVKWPTNSLQRMVPACQEFYTAVMEKSLTHDGDERLAAHVGNAVLKEDAHGPRIVKEAKGSPRKIDLAVCAVGALSEAQRLASVPVVVPRFISLDD